MSSTLASLLEVIKSYRRQALPVALELIDTQQLTEMVPTELIIKSHTMAEETEWIFLRISNKEPKSIFQKTMQRWHRQKEYSFIFGQGTLQEHQKKSPHIEKEHCDWLPPCLHLPEGQLCCISKTSCVSTSFVCLFHLSISALHLFIVAFRGCSLG